MTTPVFPNDSPTFLQASIDSQTLQVSRESTALRTPLEAGYANTRTKFTRKGRRTITCGFTAMTNAQKQALETFFTDTVMGGALYFNFLLPPDNTDVVLCRFGMEKLDFKYTGHGRVPKWDVSLVLEEV